jgi:hypothetical protein
MGKFWSTYLPGTIFAVCVFLMLAFQMGWIDKEDFKANILSLFNFDANQGSFYIPEGQYLTGSIVERGKEIYYYVDTQSLRAYGGAPLSGYTWSVASLSALPAGTTVDPLTGMFKSNGAALMPGTFTFDMVVSDGSKTATGSFSFTVQKGEFAPVEVFEQPALVTIPLPDAKTGKGYGASLWAAGQGELPWTWSLATGELPQGLAIDPIKGVIRGTPFSSAAGKTYEFTINVVDKTGQAAILPAQRAPVYVISVPR